MQATSRLGDNKAVNREHKWMMIISHTITTNVHPPDAFASTPHARALVVLKNSLLRVFVAWQAERALRRAEADLQRLDDRALKDIGLIRSEIRSVFRNPSRDSAHRFA